MVREGIQAVCGCVVADGTAVDGQMVGAEMRAVPIEHKDDAAFVNIAGVVACGTSGIEGIDATVGHRKVAKSEQVVAGVCNGMPQSFARRAFAEKDSGAIQVDFLKTGQSLSFNVAKIQTAVLEVGAGKPVAGRMEGKAVAGIKDAFEGVVESRCGALGIGDTVGVVVPGAGGDAVSASRINACGNDGAAVSDGTQRLFAVAGQVGKCGLVAGMGATGQVYFNQTALTEVERRHRVTVQMEVQEKQAFAVAFPCRNQPTDLPVCLVVYGETVGTVRGQQDKKGIFVYHFGWVQDTDVV